MTAVTPVVACCLRRRIFATILAESVCGWLPAVRCRHFVVAVVAAAAVCCLLAYAAFVAVISWLLLLLLPPLLACLREREKSDKTDFSDKF